MHFSDFANVMALIEMDFDSLYRTYVGKNVLNMIRQDRGYKQGNYQKLWHGREDNEYLVEIIHRLDPGSAAFKDEVYTALVDAYPA